MSVWPAHALPDSVVIITLAVLELTILGALLARGSAPNSWEQPTSAALDGPL